MDERRIRFGTRVRQARRAKKYSQIELAEKAQISVSHISDIENGKTNISLDIFIRLVDALQVSSDWLLQTDNSEVSTGLDREISDLLFDCTVSEKRLILRTAREMKEGLRAE